MALSRGKPLSLQKLGQCSKGMQAVVSPACLGSKAARFIGHSGPRSRRWVHKAAEGAHNTSWAQSDDEDTPGRPVMPGQHVFTFQRWAMHRNSRERYFRHMAGVFNSVTWTNLMPPLSVVTTTAFLHCCYQTWLVPKGMPSLELSDGPLQLTSFALALLMVFRTDSSYSRWSEAMQVWNTVRNTSKDLVRDAACWVKDPALLSALVRWTLTYAHSLKVYLREKGDIGNATARLLLPHEHKQFTALCRDTSTAYPQYALHVLTQAVGKAGLAGNREDKLLNMISTLSACIGNAEKLLRYPIPLSYTRHTSRFMVVWLMVLPLSLWDECGWMSIPITTIISYLLLGIEEIGVQIEEPFSLLPVRDIVRDLERDVMYITASRKEVNELLDLSLSLTHAESLDKVAAIAKHNAKTGNMQVQLALTASLSLLSSVGSSIDGGEGFEGDDDVLMDQRSAAAMAAAAQKIVSGGVQQGNGVTQQAEMSECEEFDSKEGVLFETCLDPPSSSFGKLMPLEKAA